MKIMQIMRKIHLWLGLLFSIVLLVEGITGVMVAEPGWFGQQVRYGGPPAPRSRSVPYDGSGKILVNEGR